MNRGQVLDLLGPPDDYKANSPEPTESALDSAHEFIYNLGVYSGFRMDMDVLVLYFDDDGKVERFTVYQT